MDMCYSGALVLPSSYAVMNEEEMSYTEGGWSDYIFRNNLKAAYANYKAAKTALRMGMQWLRRNTHSLFTRMQTRL